MATIMVEGAGSLRILEQADRPFRYFLADSCITPVLEKVLLNWLETDAPWRFVETDFYEQYELSMLHTPLPAPVRELIAPDALRQRRFDLERAFGRVLSERVDLVAHKLVEGQRIAIHNDYLIGQETHRFTVQLNRGLNDNDGGFFMIFNSFDAADIHRVLRPVSGTAIGFEINADSHHAVSCLHGGERYSLVYSFYAESDDRAR